MATARAHQRQPPGQLCGRALDAPPPEALGVGLQVALTPTPLAGIVPQRKKHEGDKRMPARGGHSLVVIQAVAIEPHPVRSLIG